MWARIEKDAVAELTDIDPVGRFHSSLIWVPAGDSGVQVGWTYEYGVFTPPEPVIEPPAETVEQARERALAIINPLRDIFLNRLSGISVFTDDATVRDECAALRLALLDITKSPEYLAAQTFEEMEASLLGSYRAIASTATNEIRKVFRELDA